MTIQIDPHTLERALERGATKEEIITTIQKGVGFIGKKGRLGKQWFLIFKVNGKGSNIYRKEWKCFTLLKMM